MFRLKLPNGFVGGQKLIFTMAAMAALWNSNRHDFSYFSSTLNLLLHCKFQINSPCGLREDVQNKFSIWLLWRPYWISYRHEFSSFRSRNYPCGYGDHLGFLIDMDLAHFDPEVVLLLQSKFRLKSTKGLEKDVEN